MPTGNLRRAPEPPAIGFPTVFRVLKTELEKHSDGWLAADERRCRRRGKASSLNWRRLTVATLAWGRPTAWKEMLNVVLTDDQKAKNAAVFSYQFSYQLAH